MRHIQYLLIIIFVVIVGFVVIQAQGTQCDVEDAEKVIEVVQDVCEELGDNQVCYGNFEVGADLLDDLELPEFNFETPGDIADVENIKSLYLSALNPEEDTWGIAQMRLLIPSQTGAKELNLLLFGDVEVSNSSEPTHKIFVEVGRYSAHIRNQPTVNSIIIDSGYPGSTLVAVGRLEDSSWIRVQTKTGAVGWISSNLVSPSNGASIEELEVQDDSSPYFGPMQAFIFEQGPTSACGNLTTDGLVIQTPQGPAAVNVSINGVNIELTPGKNGAATVIQGSGSNMNVGVLAGSTTVSIGGTTQILPAGTQLTVGSGGILSVPTTYNTSNLNIPGISSLVPIDPITTVGPDATATTASATTEAGSTGGTIGGSTTSNTSNPTPTPIDCNASENANSNACNKK